MSIASRLTSDQVIDHSADCRDEGVNEPRVVRESGFRMGGRTRGRRRSHSARVRRRKLVIAGTALVVVMGLAVFAATGDVTNLFTVQVADIPDTDAH